MTAVRTIPIFVALLVAASCSTSPPPTATGSPATTAATAALGAPVRAVELVIPAARRSPADADGRFLQTVIERAKLAAQPVQPVDRDGDGGAAALDYVLAKRGDAQVLLLLTSAVVARGAAGARAKVTDLVPIASVAAEPSFLWVATDSEWRTAGDFAAAARRAALAVAGAGAKSEHEALARRIQQKIGARPFAYLAQNASQDALAAVATHLGGAVAAVGEPRAAAAVPGATRALLRALCSFTADPPAAGTYRGLATCASQGIAIDDASSLRVVACPPGITAAQESYWADALRRAVATSEWKQYLADSELAADFRAGADVRALVAARDQAYRDIAAANGWTAP